MRWHSKLFLEQDNELVFGPGRVELLRAVRDLGSLRKAAAHLGMSYRWAWGRLKDAEMSLGVPLLETAPAQQSGRSKRLSPQALALLAWYATAEQAVQRALLDCSQSAPDFLRNKLKETDVGLAHK